MNKKENKGFIEFNRSVTELIKKHCDKNCDIMYTVGGSLLHVIKSMQADKKDV